MPQVEKIRNYKAADALEPGTSGRWHPEGWTPSEEGVLLKFGHPPYLTRRSERQSRLAPQCHGVKVPESPGVETQLLSPPGVLESVIQS